MSSPRSGLPLGRGSSSSRRRRKCAVVVGGFSFFLWGQKFRILGGLEQGPNNFMVFRRQEKMTPEAPFDKLKKSILVFLF
jgi:hypothetical protein